MDDQPKPSFINNILRFFRRHIFWITIIVVLALVVSAYELGRSSVYSAHPELGGQEQATDILKNVGQLIQLPANETPTIAKITDANSVRAQQPFLTNAQNGDILIVYTTNQTALLYRPSTNKLIAVGPVDTSGAPSSRIETPTPPPAATSTNATTTKSKK